MAGAVVGLFILGLVINFVVGLIRALFITWILNLHYIQWLSDLTYWDWFFLSLVVSTLVANVNTSSNKS